MRRHCPRTQARAAKRRYRRDGRVLQLVLQDVENGIDLVDALSRNLRRMSQFIADRTRCATHPRDILLHHGDHGPCVVGHGGGIGQQRFRLARELVRRGVQLAYAFPDRSQ